MDNFNNLRIDDVAVLPVSVRAYEELLKVELLLDEVDKVNVPILLIHGDVDQRVPVEHAEKYLSKLEAAGKPHTYVELEGADHFSNTLFYDHKLLLYQSMLNYLKNECGLEGGSAPVVSTTAAAAQS